MTSWRSAESSPVSLLSTSVFREHFRLFPFPPDVEEDRRDALRDPAHAPGVLPCFAGGPLDGAAPPPVPAFEVLLTLCPAALATLTLFADLRADLGLLLRSLAFLSMEIKMFSFSFLFLSFSRRKHEKEEIEKEKIGKHREEAEKFKISTVLKFKIFLSLEFT